MGRPRELSDAERADLLEKGYRPAEVWVPDWSDPGFRASIEAECRLIRESDQRTNMDQVLDAFARDLWNDLR